MAVRDKTIVISFAGVPNRPSMEELEEWFDQKCGLEEDKYMCVQLNNMQPQVSIVFVTAADAKEFAQRNQKQWFVQNGKDYPTAFWIDQDCVTSRIVLSTTSSKSGPRTEIHGRIWRSEIHFSRAQEKELHHHHCRRHRTKIRPTNPMILLLL